MNLGPKASKLSSPKIVIHLPQKKCLLKQHTANIKYKNDFELLELGFLISLRKCLLTPHEKKEGQCIERVFYVDEGLAVHWARGGLIVET